MERVYLSRNFVSVPAFGSSVNVKVAFLGNEIVNVHPEFKDCQARRCSAFQSCEVAIAVEQNIPLLQVIDEVKSLALSHINAQPPQ
ncbi:hypothetical protein KXD40_004217 [Peronospora effusa]|nr:hypothetical protein KXD40_004217 [Peronospora effusa]